MIRNSSTLRIQPPLPLPEDPTFILLTDMGNARRFAVQHRNTIRYVQAWGWVAWDGRRWQQDDTGSAMRMARETVHQLFHEAQELNADVTALMAEAERAAQAGDGIAVELAQRAVTSAQRSAKQMMDWALKSQSRSRMESLLALAKSEPELAAPPATLTARPGC